MRSLSNLPTDERKLADALYNVWNSIGPDIHLDNPMSAIDCGRACMDYLDAYGELTREEADRLAPLATDKFLEELALGY